jgi:peptidoglycan hydrolase-like protein with peptidoglycan-binding domain
VSSNSTQCPHYAKVRPSAGASATKVALVTYSGSVMRPGSTGPAVSAVQHALRLRQTGQFNAGTRAGVIRFQSSHRLPRSGVVYAATWRALLAAVR